MRRKRKARLLEIELVVNVKPLDRGDFYACAIPFITTTLQRWRSEKRVIVVDGVLRVNPDFKAS